MWNIENIFFLCLTTDHSNKPQVCQTSEAGTTRKGLELSEGEEKIKEEEGWILHTFFFLSASFMLTFTRESQSVAWEAVNIT